MTTLKEQYDQVEAQIDALKDRRGEILRASLEADDSEKVMKDFFAEDILHFFEREAKEDMFPMTVNDITFEGTNRTWMTKRAPKLVRVRPADGEETYLGIYLCELPISVTVTKVDVGALNVAPCLYNPAILIPETRRIVLGCECWWSDIESGDELPEITDEMIQQVPYMQLLRLMVEQNDT